MLIGFILTLCGFFYKRFFDWWLFRTLHLCGIIYVGLLVLLREYCPLTILENTVRAKYNPNLTYPGSFIVHYIEKLVYPDVNPSIILVPTIFIAVYTIVVFIFKPPIHKGWTFLFHLILKDRPSYSSLPKGIDLPIPFKGRVLRKGLREGSNKNKENI